MAKAQAASERLKNEACLWLQSVEADGATYASLVSVPDRFITLDRQLAAAFTQRISRGANAAWLERSIDQDKSRAIRLKDTMKGQQVCP